MADVQPEHGFTKIADEILEQMARIKLSPTQYRILFIVWRYTYGFNRKEHDLTLGFLSKATGCDKRQLQRELKGLEDRRIVFQRVTNGVGRKIKFNKNHDEWIGKTDIGETTIGEIDNGEIVNGRVGETVKATIGETDNQDIHSFKNKFKDSTTGEFEKVVSAFRELHRNVIDFPMADCSLLTGFIEQGISADFIIEIMNEKYKPSVKVFRFYKDAITERHVNKDRVLPTGRKRNEPDWEKIKKQLEDAEREFKPGA